MQDALRSAGLPLQEEDSRVKKLQELAWSLQSLTSKPGGKLPEAFKKECSRLSTDAVQLCTDASYMEEADFLDRAATFTRKIEAKKLEAADVEDREKDKLTGKCFRPAGDGGYQVGSRASENPKGVESQGPLATTAPASSNALPTLTVASVVAECADDPEALWLSDRGLRDSDLAALCQGLRQAGSNLTCLDLSHNQIADAGVQKLVGALAAGTCPKLEELWIGANTFGDLGTEMLTNGLLKLRRDLKVHAEVDTDRKPPVASIPGEEKHQAEPAATVVPQGAELSGDSAAGPPASEQTQVTASSKSKGHTLISGQCDIEELADGLRLTLRLPESIASAQDMELDVSATRLVARETASGAVLAEVEFTDMDPDSAQAKFSRRNRTMTISLSKA
mmetsp:Transcript_32008/g.75032  ORF Transcript_32008/g.75032 Transcript_32008/m.75032 type:complete len:393 (+) Transcript_32008:55-1233(+)